MLEKKTFQIKGISGLLMHNGQLANPYNKFAKEMKQYTKKRKKTDADIDAISRLEFLGGLYMDDKGNYIITPECWEATLVNAAKKSKLGGQAVLGITVPEPSILEVDGPTDPEKRLLDPAFVDARMVVISKKRVLRTRPFFPRWATTLTVLFDTNHLNESDIVQFVVDGGRMIGLLDWRPKYGRYEVVSHD